MYAPQWIRAIQENNSKRRMAHGDCLKNLQAMKPVVLDLTNWKTKTLTELQEMAQELRQGHLLMLAGRMAYLPTLRAMGTLENLIYSPEVLRQQREQEGALDALEEMMVAVSEIVKLLKEYKDTGLIPDSIEGGK